MKVKAQSRFLLLRPWCVQWRNSSRPGLFCAIELSALLFTASPSLYREYTVWELREWQITGALVFTIAGVFLILVLTKLALAQKRNLKKLTFQRELEALIAQLAAAFISLPAELVNEEIERAFSHLLQFFDLDRISLFEFSTETAELRPLCSRTVPGIEHPPSLIDLARLKWAVSHKLCDTLIQASHLDDLPEEAGELKRVMSACGVRSFIAFPLQRNGETFAALVFSTTRNEREWEPHVVQLLQTVSDIFRSALEREYAEEAAFHELSGRLISAQEQERTRIARELHDDVSQQLAVLAIELQQLERFFPQASSEGREEVRSIWKMTHELSMEVQQLSHQLHSAKLEHLGIVASLRGLSREFGAQHNIASDFQCQQAPPTIDAEMALALFRVAQEALHNVAKHSHATKVRIELVEENGKVALRVSDDGVGFDPEGASSRSGLGMISMRERVRFVGGTLSIWSKPSMGTQVEAIIPVTRKAVAARSALDRVFPIDGIQ